MVYPRNGVCLLLKALTKSMLGAVLEIVDIRGLSDMNHLNKKQLSSRQPYDLLCKWKIDPTFPKKDLLDKLKPCMFDYYMAEYVNCSTDESVYYRINLRCKLKRLYLDTRSDNTSFIMNLTRSPKQTHAPINLHQPIKALSKLLTSIHNELTFVTY